MNQTIPPEIVKFLDKIDSPVLLVKGEPGSGKTILTLQYIADQAEKGYGIYFSTRVDTKSLYSQFPWIKEKIPPENIIDATQSIMPKKMEIPHILTFSSLPDFLKGLYTLIEEKKNMKTHPIVAVDSIDAVAHHVGLPIEDACAKIIDVLKNTGTKTLIVTEKTERTALDYICDGVITLKREAIDDRLFRELVIEKLRGIEIENLTYYFTLHEGKFKYFEEFRPIELTTLTHELHPPIKDGKGTEFHEKGLFSTGSKHLDEIVGGYRKGSFVLFEIDSGVPPIFHQPSTTVENFLMQDRGVIIVPCKGLSPIYYFDLYTVMVGREKASKNCKIIDIREEPQNDQHEPWVIYTDRDANHFLETVNRAIEEFKKEGKDSILLFFSFDKIESDFGPENAEKIALEVISKTRIEKGLCMGTIFPSTKINIRLKEMADYSLKLFSKKGRVFFYGITPPTVIYNANIDFTEPHPKFYLTPIT